MATAAAGRTERDPLESEKENLSRPTIEHAPEVAALLRRLQALPPIPYLLQTALQRNSSVPKGQPIPPWNEAEKQALHQSLELFFQAWKPFLSGPEPDWKGFPDSILFFRAQNHPAWRISSAYQNLLEADTGAPQQPLSVEGCEFYLSYLRQTRHLGAIRFGWGLSDWSMSETVSTAAQTARALQTIVAEGTYSALDLQNFRDTLAPAPTLEDVRIGLDADRSLYMRAAGYLETLPADTAARPALLRWLQDEGETSWYLRQMGDPVSASDLARGLQRDAEQLELLRQKTHLAGPAWRQWLSVDPGAGLSPTLAQGLGGFHDFEKVRMEYLVTLAALDARIALEEQGLTGARQIPDPAMPGSRLTVEQGPEGVRIFSRYTPPGETNTLSFLLPDPAGPN